MKELLEILARDLVDHPEEVRVEESQGDRGVILELKVHPDDMGKVIGKQGKIAKAMRTLVKASAAKQGVHVVVEIMR
ncbi:MAG: KH domain-containing protein [Methylocystaceae bacterium]